MVNIEIKIKEKVYYFYSDKGLKDSPSKEKLEEWKILTDLTNELIVWFAKNELTVPNALKGLEIESINKYLDFVKTNFSNEIIELQDYYKNKK